MDILLPFLLGNIAKMTGHLFFPHEEFAFITYLIACAVIYYTSQRIYLATLAGAIAFATHELWFTEYGLRLGLMYKQYGSNNFNLSFWAFLFHMLITVYLIKSFQKWKDRENKHTWFR